MGRGASAPARSRNGPLIGRKSNGREPTGNAWSQTSCVQAEPSDCDPHRSGYQRSAGISASWYGISRGSIPVAGRPLSVARRKRLPMRAKTDRLMATAIKSSRRDLREDLSQISERAEVRPGSPLPLGTREAEGGVNFAVFSRHAGRARLEFFDHPEDAVPARAIDLDRAATAPVTSGTFGWRGLHPVSSMLTGWVGLTNPPRGIVSTSTGFSSIPWRPPFRGSPLGILPRHVDTIRRRRSRTWRSRSWIIPG